MQVQPVRNWIHQGRVRRFIIEKWNPRSSLAGPVWLLGRAHPDSRPPSPTCAVPDLGMMENPSLPGIGGTLKRPLTATHPSSTAGSTSRDSNIYSWGKSWFSKLLRDMVGGPPKESGPVVVSNGNAEGPESRSAPRCRVVTDAPTHQQIPIRILLQTWKFGLSFSNCWTGCNRNPACADREKHWRENCGTDAIIVTSLRHL